MRRRRGMTLAELIMALAITSIVGAGVVAMTDAECRKRRKFGFRIEDLHGDWTSRGPRGDLTKIIVDNARVNYNGKPAPALQVIDGSVVWSASKFVLSPP